MSEPTVLVTDSGFAPARAPETFLTLSEALCAKGESLAVEIALDEAPAALAADLARIDVIRIPFPAFSDGRGFTLARELRRLGFRGRLRAAGHIISDQYALARRCGFDEAEIPESLAERQPRHYWSAPEHHGYLDLLR